jgi:hypothetical protein
MSVLSSERPHDQGVELVANNFHLEKLLDIPLGNGVLDLHLNCAYRKVTLDSGLTVEARPIRRGNGTCSLLLSG